MAAKKNTKTKPLIPEKAPKQAQKKPFLTKLIAVTMVGLMGMAVLVGLGVVRNPMTGVEIKILGEQAYEQQPRTPLVARSSRDEKLTETAITLLEAPEALPQETPTEQPNEGLATLQTTLEAQQQMLRMMQQKHEEQFAQQQAQFQKLAVAFVALQEKAKPADLTSLENHIARLYLLQGIDRLYAQWQNGVLLPETVEGWAQQAAAAGFVEAEKLAIAFSSMLKDDGLLNQQEVMRAGLVFQKSYTQKPVNTLENQGFWAYLKAKLSALITVQKVGETLPAEALNSLKAGDVTAFWQALLALDGGNAPQISKMRQLVENHTSQKFAFDSLYQALADKPQQTTERPAE